jgi:hypothetical protein
MSDDAPDSPLTALDQEAVRLHEIYLSYMEAGFSEARAFELCRIILAHYLDGDD